MSRSTERLEGLAALLFGCLALLTLLVAIGVGSRVYAAVSERESTTADDATSAAVLSELAVAGAGWTLLAVAWVVLHPRRRGVEIPGDAGAESDERGRVAQLTDRTGRRVQERESP